MGAVAIGATVYFGSEDSNRQMIEVADAFAYAHELGMATILWCYMRNPAFTLNGTNHESSADLTGQANPSGRDAERGISSNRSCPHRAAASKRLTVAIRPTASSTNVIYSELSSDHPIDLTRYQVANGYMGKVGIDQFRRRQRRQRFCRSGQDSGHQQTRPVAWV